MSTLQELEEKYVNIDNNVRGLKKEAKDKEKILKDTRKERSNLEKEIDSLNKRWKGFESVSETEKDPSRKTDYQEEAKKAKIELDEKRKRFDELNKVQTGYDELKRRIEIEEKNMDAILLEFAQDPRINGYLQDEIKLRFRKRFEETEKKEQEQENSQEKFSNDLLDEKVFGNQLKAFRIAFEEFNSINPYALDPETKSKREQARENYEAKLSELNEAIKNRAEYKDLELTQADYDAMIAGPVDGKYVMPSMQENLKRFSDKRKKLQDKQDAILQKIERSVGPRTGSLATIEKQLKDMNDNIIKLEEAIKQQESNSEDLGKKLEVISNNKARLNELMQKATLPEDIVKAEKQAEADYEKALKKSGDKGIVSKDIVPDLNNPDSDIAKKYMEFKKADLKIRKAFLDCQTTDSSSDKALKDKKEALKIAISDYYNISSELKTLTGFDTNAWHQYLMRELNDKILNGETIDEAYNGELIKARISRLGKDFKVLRVDNTLEDVNDIVEAMQNKQEKILSGTAGTLSWNNINKDIDNYHDEMKNIFQLLQDTGAKGIEKIGDLFSRIKSSIIRRAGFFAKLFGRTYSDPEQATFVVSSEEDVRKLEKEVKDAREAYKKAIDNREKKLNEQISEDERKELEGLIEIDGKEEEYTSSKDSIDKNLTEMRTKKTELEGKRDELNEDKNNLEASVIKNPEEIGHGEAKKLVTKTIRKFEKDEDVR